MNPDEIFKKAREETQRANAVEHAEMATHALGLQKWMFLFQMFGFSRKEAFRLLTYMLDEDWAEGVLADVQE